MASSTQTLLSPAAAQPSSDEQSTSLGKASPKQRIDKKDIFALLGSLACLILAIFTILPYSSFPWHLGLKNQIIIIGVVLNIQNLCLQRVMQSSFILLEARLGKSVLQNYDAILRKTFISSHVHWAWRVGLCILTLLPTVLSVAYKQYLGGTSTASITNNAFPKALYGLAYPDLGSYASLSNSIYLSMNANSGFLNASRNDQEYSSGANFPLAYGYNTLVLSEDSAALLDLPLPTYITDIRRRLALNETWQVSADVDAIVATRNKSITNLRQDQIFLNQTMQYAYNQLASESLFQETMPGLGFGWMSVDTPELGDAHCLMGSFGNDSVAAPSPIALTEDASNKIYLSFMESAQMFSIRRQGCHGKWEITQSEVKLLKGHCFNQSAANSSVLHDWQTNPFAFDVLPVLVNTIGTFSTIRPTSPWKQISYVVAAANTWWARSAFLNYGTPDTRYIFRTYPETQYAPRSQSITSTKPTLDANWGLYLVLVIFPFITLMLFIPLSVFYSLPIGTGFGLISILAGIDRDTLALVRGAGLSGELDREINLEISSEAVPNSKPEVIDEASYRIRYALSEGLRKPIEAGIERGRTYE
ncbi:MAG: hypothetical protein Q9195_009532 [Heterodermia aff. obscurata]